MKVLFGKNLSLTTMDNTKKDGKQLPPVGFDYSPVFDRDFFTVELTEIIRQGEGSPIITLSRDLDL